jgi:gas vesicle protein
VSERTALLAGAALGAVIGAAAAFLFFTDRGRAVRDELEPTLRDLAREAGRLQGAVTEIRESVAGPTAWSRPDA